tara:strand:+ start:2387 stop:2728 length:342 start_codon:yes stop_codon:yes gene_type:complete
MFRYYYQEDGTITRAYEHSTVIAIPTEGTWVDDATFRDVNLWKYVDGEFVSHTPTPRSRTTAYDQSRRNNFGSAEQQMALLYDDIDSGKFGDDAKTGLWYLHVKAVKDANPKP